MQGMEEYTDNLETNGAGAATPCGRCAASQFRLVVAHEVGRDGSKGCQWQASRQPSSANVLTLPQEVGNLAGQAVGSCCRGEPQIVDCAAVTALRGC